jgi:hypothetical protein
MKEIGKKVSLGRYVVCLGIVLLGLIGLTLFLSGCEKETLGEWNGNIKINFTVGISSYGAEEGVTRSAGGQSVLETAVAQGMDGLLVSATLEEDEGSPLRDGDEPVLESIAVNVLMRIVVYNSSGTYVSSGKYRVKDATGAIVSDGQGVSVPSAGTYYFVAYSENEDNSALIANSLGNTTPVGMGVVSMGYGVDLLWGKQEEAVVEGENNINIHLKHMASRVKLKMTTDDWPGKPALSFSSASDKRFFLTESGFKLTVFSGTLAAYATTPSEHFFLSEWDGLGTSTITSKSGCLIYTAGKPFTAKVQMLYVGAGDYYYANMIPVEFTTELKSGHSYTVTVSLKRMDLVFAGSNIYWKDVPDDQDPDHPGYLTFESMETATNDSKRYQGLYFQWGSLVGISPNTQPYVGEWQKYNVFAPESTPIYVPDYTSGETPSFAWRKSTVSGENWGSAWATSIPHVTDNVTTTDRKNAYLNEISQNTDAKWGGRTGDICQYIVASGHGPLNDVRKWRMPVSIEMGTDRNAPPVGTSVIPGWQFTQGEALVGNDEGTFLVGIYMTHIATGIVFPLSGNRDYSGMTAGTTYYWTATPYNTYARHCMMVANNISNESTSYRHVAMPIRCIVDNAIDASQP